MKFKKVKISNTKITKKSHKLLMWLTGISMTIYILWRAFFTLPDREVYGFLAFFCGICLLAAEAISAFEAFLHYRDMHNMLVPEKPEIPLHEYPHVDVFIATHNESVSILYKTVNGCKHMRYPDPSKVHIYICDDTNRPEMADLAREMGINYIGASGLKHAKAGNLNNALSKTTSPYIATFDADMIPTSDFLMETVPYVFLPKYKKDENGIWVPRTEEEIDPDYKIGFIQTPQSFYNPDLFQFFLFSEQRVPNEQDYFFKEINVGRNRANAPIYAGSNTLISREALDEVGGIAIGSITEDFETGINIQAAGYTCYAISKVVAHGLAPDEFESLIKQRERWGRGCISSLRHVHILINPKLKIKTKTAYISAFLYWFTFIRRFVYIMAPIMFVVFGIPVLITDLKSLLLIWLPSYLLYNHTLKVSSGKIRSHRWSNIIDTIIFPYLILPILAETLFIKLKKFNVTNKDRTTQGGNLLMGIPHMILLVLNIVALVMSFTNVILHQNYGGIVVLYWLLVNGFNLVMAVLFMGGCKNYRSSERYRVMLPITLESKSVTISGHTMDISENGLAVFLDRPAYFHQDEALKVTITDRTYVAALECRVVNVSAAENGWKYGLVIDSVEPKDKMDYFQIVYDRHHTMTDITQPTVCTFSDLSVNIQRRMQPARSSQRKLPRIEIGRTFPLVSGGNIKVEDINYEYMRISALDNMSLPDEFSVKFGAYVIHAQYAGIRPGIYKITNYEELLNSPGYTECLMRHSRKDVAAEPVK